MANLVDDRVSCPRCGGNGGVPGSDFGDYGFHPCFFCGTTGLVALAEFNADAERAQLEVEPRQYDEYAQYDFEGCYYCGREDCNPSSDSPHAYACDQAHAEYLALKNGPPKPVHVPAPIWDDEEIPF